MATYTLRPMSTGEILDGAFALLRNHFGTLFGISIACQGIPLCLGLYVEFAGGITERPGLYFLSQLLSVLGYLLVSGATVRVVSQAYLGQEPQLGEALAFAAGKMWGIFVSGLAATIVICLALLLLIVPGIIVACGYSVVVPVVVLEELDSSTDALSRSWTLTKGFKGKAFVLWLAVVALMIVVGLGMAFFVGLAAFLAPALTVVAVAALSVVTLLVYPLTSCVFTLLYYDLRVRKEAFDIELLNQQLGIQPASA
ncbi:MAG: hypothetical protein ACREL9_00750 [Gemmatimonadales bacterium]